SWVVVLMLAWLHAPASAEPYRNADGEGEVRYADSPGQLLAGWQVGVYEKAEPEEDVTSKKKTEGEGADFGSPDGVQKEIAAPSEKDVVPGKGKEAPRAKELEETRKWLKKEYTALAETEKEIHRAQEGRLGPNARRRLDEKIKEYSKRLGEYEKKGQTYDQELEVFNTLRQEEKGLREQLRKTEIQLQKDYEILRAKKLETDRMAMEDMSRSDREELAEKLRTYNARVRDYKKRKEEFQKAIESYDARVAHALEGSK
ncbi:MAG: hypothetical protein JRI70_10720, partial [Deltaproteobacteria bacterium]|nr:hypothetical protein [Deltaproteobacteria bacterium]